MSSNSHNIVSINKTTREEIATFAAWCVGSCHGDWDPLTDAERERVMKDDIAFDWWSAEFKRYRAADKTDEPYLGSDGPFIHTASEHA